MIRFMGNFILGCMTGGVWWLYLVYKYMKNGRI